MVIMAFVWLTACHAHQWPRQQSSTFNYIVVRISCWSAGSNHAALDYKKIKRLKHRTTCFLDYSTSGHYLFLWLFWSLPLRTSSSTSTQLSDTALIDVGSGFHCLHESPIDLAQFGCPCSILWVGCGVALCTYWLVQNLRCGYECLCIQPPYFSWSGLVLAMK
jgi:hypothetical protein